jgi:hypothetical protein
LTQQQRSKGISLTDLGLDDELHTLDGSGTCLGDSTRDTSSKKVDGEVPHYERQLIQKK